MPKAMPRSLGSRAGASLSLLRLRHHHAQRAFQRFLDDAPACGGFPGVEQAYAIQAGRELRVLVSSKETTDESAAKICHDIVQAFEKQLTYPGEIKVTVVRETRHVDVAR